MWMKWKYEIYTVTNISQMDKFFQSMLQEETMKNEEFVHMVSASKEKDIKISKFDSK